MTHTEPAWAKLNLTLDILGKRPDGYHDLRMVMQSISLKDDVTLEDGEHPGIHVTSNFRFLPSDGTNIAAKAASRFFEETGLPPRDLAIHIRKEIPVCAGMAGGSSDGAAVLRILGRACRPELSREELEAIAAGVGSDVPYCVRCGTALAEGRGERLSDLPPLPPLLPGGMQAAPRRLHAGALFPGAGTAAALPPGYRRDGVRPGGRRPGGHRPPAVQRVRGRPSPEIRPGL